MANAVVTVALFGVPPLLAGERSLQVAGRTLGEAAADPVTWCPGLVRPGPGRLVRVTADSD